MKTETVFGIETLAEIFETHARLRPAAAAFVEIGSDDGETAITYAEGAALIADYAARLVGAGLKPGDRVAVRLAKSARNMLLFFAVTRAGGIYVPINPDYTDREAAVLLEDSDPALFVDDREGEGAVAGGWTRLSFGTGAPDDLLAVCPAELPPMPAPTDGALMLFTSGTTGRPKGACLSHLNLLSNVAALSQDWEITEADRLLHVLPVFHGHGLYLGVAMPMLRGATVLMVPKFDAGRTVALLPRATMFMAVPAIWTRLLDHPGFGRDACRNLRLATSGSAPLSPEVFDALEARVGMKVVERYGMTETCMLTTNPIDGTARVGSVGRPLSCIELRIADENGQALAAGGIGRVQVRGPSIITEYWRRPDKRDDWTADGWFDTGDLGLLEADGFLSLVGRSKDLIISGGYNVYPREVEIEIETFPGVAEAVVFGVPHPDFGEGVMAAIRRDESRPLDLDQLAAALSGSLARYKQPKRIVVLPDFPRNHMGKILKTELRDRYGESFTVQPAAR